MWFTTDDAYATCGTAEQLYIDYKNLTKVIEVGKFIYIDDGVMCFEVLAIEGKRVRVRLQNNGKLCSKKGVNLPKTNVDLPALSEKDKSDLCWGVEQGVDMVFASFIRSGQDIKDIRATIGEKGRQIKIIAKIENHQGVQNFADILAETDGVMVARGDLGIEIPCSRVFLVQKSLIAQCNIAGKPVICATQMLESMTYNPRPTRAEVSDVANAVLDGADCVMLSGETAKGAYPVEAVRTMQETCLLAETVICYMPLYHEIKSLTKKPIDTTEAIASAAVTASIEHNAGAIVVLTTSGNSARLLSKYRPRIPIIAVTRSPETARQTHLYRGCYPYLYPASRTGAAGHESPTDSQSWQADVDSRLMWGVSEGIKDGLVKRGEPIIAIQGWRGGGSMVLMAVPCCLLYRLTLCNAQVLETQIPLEFSRQILDSRPYRVVLDCVSNYKFHLTCFSFSAIYKLLHFPFRRVYMLYGFLWTSGVGV